MYQVPQRAQADEQFHATTAAAAAAGEKKKNTHTQDITTQGLKQRSQWLYIKPDNISRLVPRLLRLIGSNMFTMVDMICMSS